MSVILLPASLRIAADMTIEQRRFDMLESSDATGDTAVRLQAPPRWALSFTGADAMSLPAADEWRALLLQLRGAVNVLAAWDIARPVPRGTARGAMQLAAAAAAGATALPISGATPAAGTLLRGDWLQIGTGHGSSQLVSVVADVQLSGGAGVVTVEAPLRKAYAAGTVVTWDKPLCHYRRTAGAVGASWQYRTRRLVGGFSFDGLESFG